jgi:FkbM family methyltransferase
MIDVGGSYGIFSVAAARLVGEQGTVVTFEPARATFEILERNIALNHSSQVKAMRMALADKPGKLRLYHDADPSRNSLAPEGTAQDFEEVDVRTLDSVVQDLGLSRIDFIKIDAEGADELVCRGAVETLKRFRPPIFFEDNRAAASQLGLQGVGTAAFLASLGYEFHVLRDGQIVKTDGAVGGNILAIHKG